MNKLLKTKDIKINQYWIVNYKHQKRGYRGPVLIVSEYDEYNRGYECLIDEDLDINFHRTHLFYRKDFIKPTDEKTFLKAREKYLLKHLTKVRKELKNV